MAAPSSLIVIIPYYGRLEWWGHMAIDSMLRNRHTTFVLIGDKLPPSASNVRVYNWTHAQYRGRISKRFGVDLSAWGWRSTCEGAHCGRNPTNKISDTRPFLAALFEDHVRAHDWWAWADLDVMFGSIRAPHAGPTSIWNPVCPNPIGLTTWGPFTAFPVRGAPRTRDNRTVPGTRPYEASRGWRRVLRSRRQMGFDELGFSGRADEGLAALLDDAGCVRDAAWTVVEARACQPGSWKPCTEHDIDLLRARDGFHLEGAKRWPHDAGATHALLRQRRFGVRPVS